MLYVQQTLAKGERLIHIGRFHWMYTFHALLSIFWGTLFCIIVLVGSVYVQDHFMKGFNSAGLLAKVHELHPAIRLFAFFIFVMGLLRFAQMMIMKATTEIAVTSTRLIYKRGLVARYVGEMSIDRIEGINVLQTIMGRIFGYGRVMVRGMGVGEVILPPLNDPIKFRRAIEKAKTL